MNLFIVHDYGAEAMPYRYGVRFSKEQEADQYFSYYSKTLGNIRDKQLDPRGGYWKLTTQGLKIMQDVQHEVEQIIEAKTNRYKVTDTYIKPLKPAVAPKKEQSKAIINIPIANKFQTMYTETIQSDVREVKKEKTPEVIIPQVSDIDLSVIGSGLKLPPYQYQRELIKFCLDTETTLLVSPCGSGKTTCIIAVYDHCLRSGKITGPGMIIVKASLKYQWEAEVKKFSDYKPLVVQTLAQLKKKEDLFKDQFKQDTDLYILNYEALRDTKIKAAMHKINPQFVAADEAVLIKDDTTKRAKALCEFSNAKIKIAATATPVQKNPMDIFGLFKFIKPELFPRKGDFGERYVRWAQFGQYVRRPVGARNEQELHKKIAPFMIVKSKEEISKQLPGLVVLQRYCELTPKQQAQHERIIEQIEELKEQEKKISEAADTVENRLAINKIESQILMYQTFAQELADDETLLEMSESTFAHSFVTGNKSSKTELALDLIKEIIDSGEKVAIFSRYARYQTILTDRMKADPELKEVKIAYVNGSLNDKQRYEEIYTKFRDTDEYKVLLMSDAAAEGVNLSKCQYIIEMDLASSYALQTQRHGRIERADSTYDTAYVYQLICENSFDEIAQKIVSKKEGFDATIVKGN